MDIKFVEGRVWPFGFEEVREETGAVGQVRCEKF